MAGDYEADYNSHRISDMPYKIPTILPKLKVLNVVSMWAVHVTTDVIWGFVDDKELLSAFSDLQTLLQSSNTSDIRTTVKEGDFAAAFSPKHQEWYRAVILRRKAGLFSVLYIDYGNEEEVSMLRSLTPQHLNVRSPLLGVQITQKQHAGKIQELAREEFQITVKVLNELGFAAETVHNNETIMLLGFDLSHDQTSTLDPQLLNQCSHEAATTLKPAKQQEVTPLPPQNTTNNAEKINIAKKILVEREIPAAIKTTVVVMHVKSLQEIYVQETSNESEFSVLLQEINDFCNIEKNAYEPIDGEMVCAFSVAYGLWYRSLVLKRVPGYKVRVLFIDYGDGEDIPLENIRQLGQKFLQPVYSIRVSLHGTPSTVTYKDLCGELVNERFDLQVVNSEVMPKQVILFKDGKQVFGNDNGPAKCAATCSDVKPSKTVEMPRFLTKQQDLEADVSVFEGAMVRIEHIDPLKIFYVCLTSQDSVLASMQKQLSEYCESKPQKVPYVPEIDDVVCVRYNGSWKRGYIAESTENTCVVKLVDYGPTSKVSINDVMSLPPQFYRPFFVISVCLESVPESILTSEVCASLKRCRYTLKFSDKSKQPLKCKMYLEGICINDGQGICINDGLVEEEKKLKNAKSLSPVKSVKSKHLRISDLKTQKLPMDDILEVIFYFKENDNYFLQKRSDYEKAVKFAASLKSHCDTSDPLAEFPQFGDVVCAKASDGQWYRASAGKVCSAENKCRVYFLDYGNIENVAKDDMRSFPSDLANIPVFCICVKVANAMNYPIKMEKLTIITPCKIVTDPQVVNVYSSGENFCSDTSSAPEENHVSLEPTVSTFAITNLHAVEFQEGRTVIVIYSVFGDTIFAAPYNIDDLIANLELVIQITYHCNHVDMASYEPALQEVVLAKYCDGSWYRAVVQNIKDGSFELLFIDFGGCEEDKKPVDIRRMTETFFQLPIQAKSCKLGGFNYDKSDAKKVLHAVEAELQPFTEVDALVTKRGNEIILTITSLIKKLEDVGVV